MKHKGKTNGAISCHGQLIGEETMFDRKTGYICDKLMEDISNISRNIIQIKFRAMRKDCGIRSIKKIVDQKDEADQHDI